MAIDTGPIGPRARAKAQEHRVKFTYTLRGNLIGMTCTCGWSYIPSWNYGGPVKRELVRVEAHFRKQVKRYDGH